MTGINQEMTVLKYLEQHAAKTPDEPHLVDRRNGEDVCYSFAQVQEIVEATAKSLAFLFGAEPTKVSILAKNRAHWTMCDLGVMRAGHVLAPVFVTMPPATFRYAMDFAEIKLLFVGEAANWEEVKGDIADDITIVSLPGGELAEADYTFNEFLALGINTPLPVHPDSDSVCTMVFTSGTTGMPKSVMHSLKSLDAFVSALVVDSGQQRRFFSYLPLAHLGDRAASVFHAIHTGSRLTFNDSVETFGADLKAAAPTFLMGVPRIWEKLLHGVLAKIGIDAETLKAKLEGQDGEALALQIRAAMGFENISYLCAATAPTSPAIKEWYARLGMPLHDVYGQTELTPMTRSSGAADGSEGVGKPFPGFEVKIAENGEIVCRGPGQALGYYNNPEKTAETFVDGWVHTGDKGMIDDQGNLHIIGRVQDTFKTAKGKYVAPVPIENAFSRSTLVEQQCLYGFGLTQTVMLCTLSETASPEKQKVEEELKAFTDELNTTLEPHERIGGVIISEPSWTPESGVLTHTMKVQRSRVEKAYKAQIEALEQMMSDSDRTVQALWVE